MKSIELFAGGGGLALGMAEAGYEHVALVERDKNSCDTLRLNRDRGIEHASTWNVAETPVEDYAFDHKGIEVVAGGVPCQPFSIGGKHRAHADRRDMFPQFARAVNDLRPKAFICENVKGLTRQSFSDYFEYIVLRLTYPTVLQKEGDSWADHCRKLEGIHTSSRRVETKYNVVWTVLNAANYGVPQRRERVFFVGIREDLGVEFSFPKATHSQDALLYAKWVTGEYWDRHKVPKSKRPEPGVREKRRAEILATGPFSDDGLAAWVTVREALAGLKKLRVGTTDRNDPNHFLNPGARSYKGHTGSPLDLPAKTLKAGDHGVPGGENTLALPGGGVRYFSPREAARIQSFPDEYYFSGAWTERMRQIGNAVPVELARVVSGALAEKLTA